MKQFDMSKSVFYERYKPSCVEDLIIPKVIKTKLIDYITTQNIPNIGMFSSNPGCVLPGTTISVRKKKSLLSYKEVKKKYHLNKLEMTKLKNYVPYLNKQFDDNLIQIHILKIITLRGSVAYSFTSTFKGDKKYKSKYLKVSHWIYVKNSIEEAVSETERLRKFVQYFDGDIINRGYFNPKNIKESLLRICFDAIYSDAKNIVELYPYFYKVTSKEFWLVRGWSDFEAMVKVSELQNIDSIKKYKNSYINSESN